MLLVFDIGNTNTVMGIFDGDKLVGHWRLTSRKRTADEVGFMIQGMLSSFGIDKGAIDGAIFGSVVPPLDEMIRGGVRKYIGIECLRVTAKLNTGLTIKMKNPTGIGADRIVNAVAAREKYGFPFVVSHSANAARGSPSGPMLTFLPSGRVPSNGARLDGS